MSQILYRSDVWGEIQSLSILPIPDNTSGNNDFSTLPPKKKATRTKTQKNKMFLRCIEIWCAHLHTPYLHKYAAVWPQICCCLVLLDTPKGSPPSANLYLHCKSLPRLCRQAYLMRTREYYAYYPDSTPPARLDNFDLQVSNALVAFCIHVC